VRLLDRALFRRFDAVVEYHLPSKEIATRVMRGRLGLLDTSTIDWSCAADAAEGLSHDEITHACEQAAKNAILEHSTQVRNDELIHALEDRRGTRTAAEADAH
jgi:AAA+ superfamily predicted ATPase